MNDFKPFNSKPAVLLRAIGYLQTHSTVNRVITAMENVTDPLKIDGLALRIYYLMLHKLTLRLLQTFVGLLLPKLFFLDHIKVNYLNLHFPKK